MANKNNEDIYCSFCGKPQEMAGRLIAGNGVYICDRCVEALYEYSSRIRRALNVKMKINFQNRENLRPPNCPLMNF